MSWPLSRDGGSHCCSIVAGTYDAFKAEILEFYIGTDYIGTDYIGMDNNHQWTLQEYNTLVGDTFRTGISDLHEYTKFYREFYPICKYLALKMHPELTECDAFIALLCLIPVQYVGAISARLSHKVPDKHQEDAYTVAQAHEAISYCLADAGPFSGLGGLPHLGQAEHATASPVPERPLVPRCLSWSRLNPRQTSYAVRSSLWCPKAYTKHCEASSRIWAGEDSG